GVEVLAPTEQPDRNRVWSAPLTDGTGVEEPHQHMKRSIRAGYDARCAQAIIECPPYYLLAIVGRFRSRRYQPADLARHSTRVRGRTPAKILPYRSWLRVEGAVVD